MQIAIDTKILETMLAHVVMTARLASHIDHDVVVDGVVVRDELAKASGELRRIIEELLDESDGMPLGEESVTADEPPFEVADAVDEVRQLIARADALAHAAEGLFDGIIWSKEEGSRHQVERAAHLVGATAEAVRTAVAAGDRLARKLALRRPRA
jgi:hypothetical protein